MPKPKSIESYPQAYFHLFDFIVEHGEKTLTNLTKKEAQALRFDLYSFRTAVSNMMPDLGRKYQRTTIIIELPEEHAFASPEAQVWHLRLMNIDHTDLNKKILDQLGGALLEASSSTPMSVQATEPLPPVDLPNDEPSAMEAALSALGFTPDDDSK